MLVNPEVQRKAQEELDRVVGRHRLPGDADMSDLPYIIAIVKETLRLYPNGPMGVPHRAIAEDVYNGFRVPKGSIVMSNIWSALCNISLNLEYNEEQ